MVLPCLTESRIFFFYFSFLNVCLPEGQHLLGSDPAQAQPWENPGDGSVRPLPGGFLLQKLGQPQAWNPGRIERPSCRRRNRSPKTFWRVPFAPHTLGREKKAGRGAVVKNDSSCSTSSPAQGRPSSLPPFVVQTGWGDDPGGGGGDEGPETPISMQPSEKKQDLGGGGKMLLRFIVT